MTNGRRLVALKQLVTAALLCALGTTFVRAEVGAILATDSGPRGPYVIGIIEDLDPVPTVWGELSTQHANRVVLNPAGAANGDGRPSILKSLNGVPMVAWSRNSAGGFDVVISQFVGGSWTEPQVLAASPADDLDPFLLMNPADGSVHLLYWIHDAAPRVMHRQATPDLASWSAPLQISQPAEIACRPAAVFHEGMLRVVYEVHDYGYGSTPRQIVLSSWDGVGLLNESLAITQHPGQNWPHVHSGNCKLWIDWIDAEGEMTWRRKQSGSAWEPVEIETYTTPREREYHVRGEIKSQAIN